MQASLGWQCNTATRCATSTPIRCPPADWMRTLQRCSVMGCGFMQSKRTSVSIPMSRVLQLVLHAEIDPPFAQVYADSVLYTA
jgi:hypothetical protein